MSALACFDVTRVVVLTVASLLVFGVFVLAVFSFGRAWEKTNS